ncbi:hypothetical protein ACTA71_006550 [Dictyostelium dimigraforme]
MGNSLSSFGMEYGHKHSPKGGNVKIIYAWICLRAIKQWWKAGANHWSVILQLDNGQYVCTQKADTGAVFTDVVDSLRGAVFLTYGDSNTCRLSKYGTCDESWDRFYNYVLIYEDYTLSSKNCQNYARDIIKYLTDKTVGYYPIEDGGEFEQ